MKKQNIMENVFTEEMFTDCYVRLRPGMMCYFRSRVGREDICEDLTQDVFERIWRHRDHVRPAEVEFLIRTVARNVAADFLRRRGLVRRHMVETEDDNVFLRAAGGRNTVEEECRAAELRVAHMTVVNKLPVRSRQAYLLYFYKYASYADIARDMGVSVRTVGGHLQTAFRVVREGLLDWRGAG